MLTVQEAFKKFKSRLELTEREQQNASRRQQEIRAYLDKQFAIDEDFLSGSYKRWTKTKPLKDVDIFCVLGNKERHFRDKAPKVLLGAFQSALADKYSNVSQQRRSVTVKFDVKVVEDVSDNEEILSFDVVPAFVRDNYYEIPDLESSDGWTKTNPKIHYDRAVEANQAYGGEWKALVRMVKYWNNHHEKPIKPSFLIEVMALEVLVPPSLGRFDREIQSMFATLGSRIHGDWADPAGLGPDVSDSMDQGQREHAKEALRSAERSIANACHLERMSRNGDALRAWREFFGPLFPLS